MSTSTEELLNRLRSAEEDVRTRAASHVREETPPVARRAVINRLSDHLDSTYCNRRWQAARALGLIGSARNDVLSKLSSRLYDKHKYVRRCAAEALGRIGSAHEHLADRGDVTDALSACREDESEEVRQAASWARETIAGRARSSSRGSTGSAPDGEVSAGKVYEGEVRSVKGYGAFVEILPGRVGLLHVTEMDYCYIADAADYFETGDQTRVKVLEVRDDGEISLTRIPCIEANPWDDIEEEYSVGDTARGRVASIQDCGALVNLEVGVTGLVPVSEMGEGYVDCPSEIVSVGQEIEAEILEISPVDERVILRLRQSGRSGQRSQKYPEGSQSPNGPFSNGGSSDGRSSNERSLQGRQPEREVLLIDGSNVCRNWPTSGQEASLNVLLTLLLELVDRGFDFECIFDANLPHVLQSRAESGAEATCRRLAKELDGRMSRVPGGTDADDPILQKAEQRDLRIVTNDRFREKRETYPWVVERESERLIKGSVHGTDLQVVSLGLFTEVRTDTRSMADQLVRTIRQDNKASSRVPDDRFRGTLKWFDPGKGFGFIKSEACEEDLFLHRNNIRGGATGGDLRKGQEITFGIEHTPKGLQAVEASPIKENVRG